MFTPLTTRLDGDGEDVIVTVTGDLDMDTGDAFPSALAIALREASRALIIDVAGVTFLASFGVGLLVRAHRDAEAAGLSFEIWNPSPTSRRVLEICGVLDVLP